MVNTILEDELISREIFFGNPDRAAVRLSGDAKYISFLAPHNGVLNIWVAPYDDISKAKLVTDSKKRGIRGYFWSKDNNYVIYSQDSDGDENWSLYSVNIHNLEVKAISPENKVYSYVLKLSDKFPQELLVGMNDRVPEYFDIYKINIVTGDKELVYENKEKYSSFGADDNFNIRLGYKMLSNGEGETYLFEKGDLNTVKLFKKTSVEDMLTSGSLHFSSDGKKLFMIDSANRNTSSLVEVDLDDFSHKIIHADPRADISDYLVDVKTKMIQAVAINYMRKEWKVINKEIANDLEYLKTIEDGDVEIISRSEQDNKWIVVFFNSDTPTKYYLYDRQKRSVKFLFVSNSKQKDLKFAKMYPVKIKSRDNLDLISYITIPRWLDNGSGIPKHPVPLILNVHGGPNARDSWGFRSTEQWLANRGYAVLNVNYRASTGFGKDFINAGDGEWSGKMQRDLEDGVKWAIDNKITTKDQIVIMGGSYGGYATLVGMTMTPDMYLAGIDIVGISNLETFSKTCPPYWKPYSAHLQKMLGGSADTEKGRKILKEKSPLTYVKNIKKPLLIVHGANDPRVNQAESDQIVKSMKDNSIDVWYLLYSDEGHGLARPENRLSMYAYLEMFLAKFAGGRFIPNDGKFPGSSVEIKEGKDL